jgi:hypothetical protein
MAVYPGPAGKGAANEAKALPPGCGIEEQRPRQYSLSPLSRQERGGTSNKPLPRTGVRRSLPVQALQEATVVRLPDGRRLWRMNIASPGAMGMRIHLRRFDALGGQLWAYTPQEADRAVESEGPFVNQGPFADGDFWTGILPGESVTIEYLDAASNSEKPLPPFEIDSILHIWERPILPPQDAASVSGLTMNLTGPPPMRGVFPELPSASTAAGDSINEVAACHLDVTCYPNYQGVSKGVVRFNFVGDDGGSYLCSGSMINTQNRSFAPYLLTAYHCIGSDAEA